MRSLARTFALVAVLLLGGHVLGSSANLQEARPTVEWFTRGVMYQVQPRAFTPEGTLKSIEAKLPYLKDLGVTIVYLVPVFVMDDDMDKSFWSPRQVRSGFDNPKNQYRIKDYFHVDPEYGTDQDLKDLVAAAHRLGLKVIFDLVYFHAGPTAKVWQEHPEFTNWNKDGTIAKGQWRFPRFNFRVPGVREYLWGNMVALIRDFDVDGYRCDVGDAMPLDFWCEGHRRMDAVKKGTILLCEGYDEKDQETAFDADYGWFPAAALKNASELRKMWEYRDLMSTQGARFVNHYENHDIATDLRPRREAAWGRDAVEQVLVWMFSGDGVPMLFTGNEIADADVKHSMFGKTPMDWKQLDSDVGRVRHAFVKELASLRAAHPAFTDFNGKAGLSWLDVTQPESVTAFVRRAKDGQQIVVVQNWTAKAVETEVTFAVKPDDIPDYLEVPRVDRSVKGHLADKPLLARRAERVGARGFRLGAYGFAVYEVEPPASAEMFPFAVAYEGLSPLVSMRALLEAPAGCDGRIRVKDGHFATDKGPIRFNAINLTGSANLPSKRFADRMADRLADLGINCVRLHFLDSPRGYETFMLPREICLIDETDDPFAYRINPERLDRLEYLIAAFKRRGIYVNLNLHVARFMYAGKKGQTWLDRRIIDSEKAFARAFLTHRNPYTGMTLAEDPVVAMIEFNNEDAPFDACSKALKTGEAGTPASMADRERRYLMEMRALIKDELKCDAPLTGTQVTYTSAHVQSCLDYFDAHEYWCHPSPVNKSWLVADTPQVNYPCDNCVAWLASRRVRGRPFTVSEYNNPYPNRYGTEGQLLLHAYGAYQGWDGLFAYSYDNRCDSEPDHVEYFFSLVARTDVLAHLPACAALFLRGDVKACGKLLSVGATREDWLARYQKNHVIFDDVTQVSRDAIPYGAGLVTGLEFVLNGEKPAAKVSLGSVLVSDTGELEWNTSVSNAGYVVARAANTKFFTGFVRGRVFDLGDGVSLAIGKTARDWATVSLVSKEANGFGQKGPARLLLAVTGQAHNTGAKFTEFPQADGTVKISTRGDDWGGGPFLVEGVSATLTLPAGGARCWALDGHGNRLREVPTRAVKGGVAIDVGPRFRTIWYEVETGVKQKEIVCSI